MRDLPVLPGYEVERLLGEGAYGRVFLAREREGLQRPVALKLFSRERRADFERELAMTRRVEEVRRAARASSLVQAQASGEADGAGFIAFEWLEGGSVQDLVEREGPLPHGRAVALARDAGQAVAALHAAGLFHRDVKPANLLLGADGRARLGDFGLSRALSGSLSAAGSPAFAAPEVIAGRPVDGRLADVYSLGATLSYLLTGETMLPGRPDLFALERRGVPRPLQEQVLQATVADPAERTKDVTAFLAGLEESSRTNSGVRHGPFVGTGTSEGAAAARGATSVLGPSEDDPVSPTSTPPATPAEPELHGLHGAPAPRRSKRAISSLVCALLALLSLWLISGPLSRRVLEPSVTAKMHSVSQRVDPRTGATIYDLEYIDEEGDRGHVGPSLRPLTADDVPPYDGTARAIARVIVAILILTWLVLLEALAFGLGVGARRAIDRSAGALTGRPLATAALVVAWLNVPLVLLAAVGFLATTT